MLSRLQIALHEMHLSLQLAVLVTYVRNFIALGMDLLVDMNHARIGHDFLYIRNHQSASSSN